MSDDICCLQVACDISLSQIGRIKVIINASIVRKDRASQLPSQLIDAI
jgi:hypothetical protein